MAPGIQLAERGTSIGGLLEKQMALVNKISPIFPPVPSVFNQTKLKRTPMGTGGSLRVPAGCRFEAKSQLRRRLWWKSPARPPGRSPGEAESALLGFALLNPIGVSQSGIPSRHTQRRGDKQI